MYFFQNSSNLYLLTNLFDLLKKQSLLFYLENSVLNELLNNPTPSFKESILYVLFKYKCEKIFAAGGYFTVLGLSC